MFWISNYRELTVFMNFHIFSLSNTIAVTSFKKHLKNWFLFLFLFISCGKWYRFKSMFWPVLFYIAVLVVIKDTKINFLNITCSLWLKTKIFQTSLLMWKYSAGMSLSWLLFQFFNLSPILRKKKIERLGFDLNDLAMLL